MWLSQEGDDAGDVSSEIASTHSLYTPARRARASVMGRIDLYPARLLGDSAYGSAEMLGWLVHEHGIEPHVTVFDKSARKDGTFSREDFKYDPAVDVYVVPAARR